MVGFFTMFFPTWDGLWLLIYVPHFPWYRLWYVLISGYSVKIASVIFLISGYSSVRDILFPATGMMVTVMILFPAIM